MRTPIGITVSLLLAAGLTAQAQTATDYGSAATQDTKSTATSLPQGTAITKTNYASVSARLGYSYASSSARVYANSLTAYEYAYARGNTATTKASAGTTTNTAGNVGDAHAVINTMAIQQGTKGQVEVTWYVTASTTGAAIKAVVNIDGTDVVTFTEKDVGTTKRFDVTAGASGVAVKITTSGSAAVTGTSTANYNARVYTIFKEGQSSSQCTLTPFGSECGLKLIGDAVSVKRGSYTYDIIKLEIQGAAKIESAIVAIGDPLTTPVPLPAGSCNLLVNPVVILPLGARRTYSVMFRPPKAASISTQGVTIALSPTGVKIATSNGLTIKCP